MKQPNILIRPATDADIPAVHGLVYELAVYENEPDALVATPAEYLQDFQDGLYRSHVAEVDGMVVGMIIYYMTYSTWKGKMLYLEDFYVQEAYRRFGLGQRLFDFFFGRRPPKGLPYRKMASIGLERACLGFLSKKQRYHRNRMVEWQDVF